MVMFTLILATDSQEIAQQKPLDWNMVMFMLVLATDLQEVAQQRPLD